MEKTVYVELAADPLLPRHVSSHCGRVPSLQQVVIKFARALITPRQFLELLLHRRRQLQLPLQYVDLSLNLALVFCQIRNAQLILLQPRTQLLDLRRFDLISLRRRRCRPRILLRPRRDPLLQLLNLIFRFNYVRMLWRVS